MGYRYLKVQTVHCDNCAEGTALVITNPEAEDPHGIYWEEFMDGLKLKGWVSIRYDRPDPLTGEHSEALACSKDCQNKVLEKLKSDGHQIIDVNRR